mmetsp:Transcript_124194/g.386746  ORF Transcript_124194/g.386746 Transcript_124194/m.386746 type:complete len:267 (+) Transcript_124194:55-855(+)
MARAFALMLAATVGVAAGARSHAADLRSEGFEAGGAMVFLHGGSKRKIEAIVRDGLIPAYSAKQDGKMKVGAAWYFAVFWSDRDPATAWDTPDLRDHFWGKQSASPKYAASAMAMLPFGLAFQLTHPFTVGMVKAQMWFGDWTSGDRVACRSGFDALALIIRVERSAGTAGEAHLDRCTKARKDLEGASGSDCFGVPWATFEQLVKDDCVEQLTFPASKTDFPLELKGIVANVDKGDTDSDKAAVTWGSMGARQARSFMENFGDDA